MSEKTDQSYVVITNCAVDQESGECVIRGVVEASSLNNLCVGSYQRGVIDSKKVRELQNALRNGGVPDILLGMRGRSVKKLDDGRFMLMNDVYIIDGLQRQHAATGILHEFEPRIGAKIHVDTNEEKERIMFREVNKKQTRLSNNVILRNEFSKSIAISVLHGLSTAGDFRILIGNVCWEQTKGREHLLSAIRLVKLSLQLHGFVFGYKSGTEPMKNVMKLDRTIREIGVGVFTTNIKTFFELIDECWNISSVSDRGKIHYIKANFLDGLAGFFSNHHKTFFSGKELFVDKRQKRKIASIDIGDPHIIHLVKSGRSDSVPYVESLIREHYNKGKKAQNCLSAPDSALIMSQKNN